MLAQPTMICPDRLAHPDRRALRENRDRQVSPNLGESQDRQVSPNHRESLRPL